VTHEYTLLVGGTIIPGGAERDATAIAWAEGTVLAIGSDDEVRAISRGDSAMLELNGATVIPLAPGAAAAWPVDAALEVGGPADLAVLRADPRRGATLSVLALVRAGHVVAGTLPGLAAGPPAG
jgi:predicted amidohydrolase YtcJ